MDIDSLKCFLTAAEYCNFSETAERLYLTQSTVSRRIARLEDELGAKLFERAHSTLVLTEIGKSCLNDVRSIVSRTELMCQRINRMKYEKGGTLRVLCYCPCNTDEVAKVITSFIGKHEDVRITILRTEGECTKEVLLDGTADLLLSIGEDFKNLDGINMQIMIPQHIVASVNPHHRFAGIKSINFSELKTEQVFLWERFHSPNMFDKIVKACIDNSFVNNVESIAGTMEDVLLTVVSNQGICIHSSGMNSDMHTSIPVIPIVDLDIDVDYCAVWLKDTKNTLIEPFVKEMMNI